MGALQLGASFILSIDRWGLIKHTVDTEESSEKVGAFVSHTMDRVCLSSSQ
jgi:hypothetical protein